MKIDSTWLRSIVKAAAATAPFTGGLAQLLSDIEQRQLGERQEEIVDLLALIARSPEDTKIELKLRKLLKNRGGDSSSSLRQVDEWHALLREVCISEIPRQLASIQLDTLRGAEAAASRLISNPSFSSELSSPNSTFTDELSRFVASSYSPAKNFGLAPTTDYIDKPLHGMREPLVISFPPIMLGVAAILFYLRDVKKYPITLRMDFAHAIDLALRFQKGEVVTDICILGDAPSLQIINNITRPRLSFLMFLPRVEQRIFSPRGFVGWRPTRRSIRKGVFTFISDDISTTLFHYERLCREGAISVKTPPDSREPHETVKLLTEGDPDRRFLLWTPHWQIYELRGLGSAARIEGYQYWFDTMLFVRSSFLSRKKRMVEALSLAIRSAWQDLRNRQVLEACIDNMMNDPSFLLPLKRFTGLHNLNARTAVE